MDAKEFQDINYQQIQEGLQAADEGRFVDDAEMQRIFNKYKTPFLNVLNSSRKWPEEF